MVGATLSELRERIADRHEEGGRYYVGCARTGERPVPTAGKRFPDRETAVEAAELAASYRAELRQYDPRLPRYDLIVSEHPGDRGPVDPAPVVDPVDDRPAGADFCHRVAAATFEALSALDRTDVERAVMDAYLHSAESVTDEDELCLVLLSTMATELGARLSPDRQASVLREAADRLGSETPTADPLAATLDRLDDLALVGDYSVSVPAPAGDESPADRTWAVAVEGYAFAPSADRLPTLPLVVELLRRLPEKTLAVTDVRRTGAAHWRCLVTAGADRPAGMVSAAPDGDGSS